MGALSHGDHAGRTATQRVAAPVATLTDLKAMSARSRVSGMRAMVTADGSRWRYHATSTLTGDDSLVAAPSDGAAGRWLREPGAARLGLTIAAATADAAVLLTVPAGCHLLLLEPYWDVATSFTGGSSSAIGLSSSNKTGFTTKGDLLGGAGGDVAAALTSGASPNPGTIGAGFDTLAKRRVVWKPTETIRFDRIASAFTAGAGEAVLPAHILKHAGA